MSIERFRVGYIEPSMYPSFEDTLQAAPEIELVRIPRETPPQQAIETLRTCRGYYVQSSRDELPRQLHVTAALLSQLPALRIVASYGAGYDTIDVAACTNAGVLAVNQAGGNARAVAEHAVGMMITLLKRIPEAQAAMRAGAVGARTALMGRELAGRTVGIVGLGHVGECTVSIVKGFGCDVVAYDPYVDDETCARKGAVKVTLGELLARSDVVSLHCPLTTETRNLFSAERLAAMRPGSIFINTARGSTYDETALHASLVSGHIGGAGLDVWEQEPPPAQHPLLTHPAVLSSPHTAGVTHESRNRVASMAAQAFIALARGEAPPRCLNPGTRPSVITRVQPCEETDER